MEIAHSTFKQRAFGNKEVHRTSLSFLTKQKRPAPQGEEGQGDSRPNSIESNASYHSTRADFELSSDVHIHTGDEEDLSELSILDISGSSKKHEIEEDASWVRIKKSDCYGTRWRICMPNF